MMGYDEFGHMVYQKLGNGTETTYEYDRQRQRLQEMNLSAAGSQLMQNRYEYDKVDNILSLVNNVNPQNLTQQNRAKLGGMSSHSYQYDELNRLIHATGKAKSASYDMAMTFNSMSMPMTKVQNVDSTTTAQSYNNTYLYEDTSHPTAPTRIGNERYEYDANGNPVLVTNDSTQQTRELYWDEENRLMVLSDNGKTSRYTYNHAGVRIVKSHGDLEGVYINGAPQGITFHEHDDFTIYPASIISINKNRFTKHYFIGSQRIASRIGSGQFNNVYGRNGSYVTAGQQDYAERLNQIEQQRENYYRDLGIAPGVPTMKGAYGDPENTGVGYNTIITELGDHSVPKNWEQYIIKKGKGETPGPPIIWGEPQSPEEVEPGYGYVSDDTAEEETFFYHSDHLGSTSYITDQDGNITQYTAYLPYGELLVDEHSSSEELPYKFNGKELDEETGLYYYGARYLNPISSIWYGIDPLTEKYPSFSGYVHCHSNPINRFDPNGSDVILLVWATGNGGYGHAAVAISNYKKQYYKVKEQGKTVIKSKMVADGTYTYYDLWPGIDNDGDGVSDGIGSAGPKDAFSGPIAEYQIFKNLTENQLINEDPSKAEGKVADGIIKLYSSFEEDMEAIVDINNHMQSNKEYKSVTNNCSDFACSGVAEALDRYKWWIEINGANESAYGIHYTTPNALYKYVRDRVKSNPKEGRVLRNPGAIIDTKFKDAVIAPAKQLKGN